jgi:glucan phosphorylase
MNGTIHFSVLDGWWVKVTRKEQAGLANGTFLRSAGLPDELDAESIYNIFEDEIIPLFIRVMKGTSPNSGGLCEKYDRTGGPQFYYSPDDPGLSGPLYISLSPNG